MDRISSSLRNLFGSHAGMMVVCVALMGGALVFLWNGGLDSESGGAWVAFLPLLICVGAHLFMQRAMGHGEHQGHGEAGARGHAGHGCCGGHGDKPAPTVDQDPAGKRSPAPRVTRQAS